MVGFLLFLCTSWLLYLLYTLFLGYKKDQQHDKHMLLAQAVQENKFLRARRTHNLNILRTTMHSDDLCVEINREIRTYTPVKTGPQSYPSRRAYLRRRLVIARQSYRALQLDPPNSTLGCAQYLHRQRR